MHPPHSLQNHDVLSAPSAPVRRHGLGLAARHDKAFGDHRHLQAEGAAGCTLAIDAMAGIDKERYGVDFEANCFAGAAAAKR
jgi:hypothetical protein